MVNSVEEVSELKSLEWIVGFKRGGTSGRDDGENTTL